MSLAERNGQRVTRRFTLDQKVANQSGTPVFAKYVTGNQTKTLLVNTEANFVSLVAQVRRTFGMPVGLALSISLRGKILGSNGLSSGLVANETLVVQAGSLPGGMSTSA